MQLAALLFIGVQAGLVFAQDIAAAPAASTLTTTSVSLSTQIPTTLVTASSTKQAASSQTASSQVTAQGGIQDYDGAPVSTDDGSSGDQSGSFKISSGALTAIIVVCVSVVILGIASTVLFVVAKRRQWNIRASIARASRRLTGRAPAKDPERDVARSRRTGTYFGTPPKAGVKAVLPPGHKRGLVVDVQSVRNEKSSDSLNGKATKYNPTKEQTTKKSILTNGRKAPQALAQDAHLREPRNPQDTMSSVVEAAQRQAEKAAVAAKELVSEAPAAVQKAKDNPQAATQSFLRTPYVRAALPFVNGGLAGMAATTVIQPVDMIKEILASGRFLDLYTGLSAGLLRQAVYTTARLGFFDTFMKSLTARAQAQGKKIGFGERATAGLTAGGLAAMVGNPADLALIRMQSDGLKPVASRANYRGVGDALMRIVRNEGVVALWSGCAPTVVRAMALNFGQLAFFSEAKAQLKDSSLGPRAQTLTASAVAGFFASFFSLPFDFVKTRLQKQTRAPDGTLPYKGMIDCFQKVIREEGPLRFYRGFSTYYVRIAPHAMVTLIVADYLNFLTQ
ncbi:hypothetical protein AMS68_007089 [Peltaster fructicola]|uniref:Mitochondrial 2-oxoglutarate/malate carrier protein n=1 Tax=Peltaster fructicola TaxID=286661 RepID=A0A6H0Y3H7_9PEZI|nr:hypothetical protein AMS68_007089 [Peltaster fructicola]